MALPFEGLARSIIARVATKFEASNRLITEPVEISEESLRNITAAVQEKVEIKLQNTLSEILTDDVKLKEFTESSEELIVAAIDSAFEEVKVDVQSLLTSEISELDSLTDAAKLVETIETVLSAAAAIKETTDSETTTELTASEESELSSVSSLTASEESELSSVSSLTASEESETASTTSLIAAEESETASTTSLIAADTTEVSSTTTLSSSEDTEVFDSLEVSTIVDVIAESALKQTTANISETIDSITQNISNFVETEIVTNLQSFTEESISSLLGRVFGENNEVVDLSTLETLNLSEKDSLLTKFLISELETQGVSEVSIGEVSVIDFCTKFRV